MLTVRIVLDLQACQTPSSRTRGIGRYSMALAQAIARQSGPHELWLTLNGNFADAIGEIRRAFETLIPPERIAVYQVPGRVADFDPANGWRRGAAEVIRRHFLAALEPDIVHLSSLFEGLTDDEVTSTGGSDFLTSVTLYDLIPLVFEKHYLQHEQTRAWYLRKVQHLKQADLLLAISDYSRREAIERLSLSEMRVVNVSTAVDARFAPRAVTPAREYELRRQHGLDRSFVMYTGGFDFRKNIESLIEAYAQLPGRLRARHQLAVVCSVKENERQQLLRHAAKAGLGDDELIMTGFVPDDDLIALYNLCFLFVFPSHYEGFGLPALEAMACGAAVIGSNTSSIPEVIGRKDALFDPKHPAAIAEVMARVLGDEDLRRSLRNHGLKQASCFSWEQSARQAISAFEMLHTNKATAGRSRTIIGFPSRPRLAYVSPLPPERSGIASYSAELLPELARHYDIELVVHQETVEHPWLTANFPVRDVAWFDRNADRFDRILYQFGNSYFHRHMFELLERHPGVVVLHDFFFGGVLHWLDIKGVAPGSFRQALYQAHGYPALFTHQAEGADTAINTYPINKVIVDQAVGVIVHSHFAFEAAHRWYLSERLKNWRIIPQLRALPTQPPTGLRGKLGLAEEDFIICSFGIVDPIKLTHRLVEAFLNSNLASDPRCRLVLVGECPDDYRRSLGERQASNPARDRVQFVGFADTETYQAYLATADLAVQLRARSRGETSRSVLDALAYGLPLIVNACGAMAELPDDCAIKLKENFTNSELVRAIERAFSDRSLQKRLADTGRRYIHEHHHPIHIAEQYYEAIEALSTASDRARYLRLVSELAEKSGAIEATDTDLATAAVCIARNFWLPSQPQLLLDISGLDPDALPSQTRDLLDRLLRENHSPWRVEPIYWDGARYRYALAFGCRLLKIPEIGLEETIADLAAKDQLMVLGDPNQTAESSRFARFREAGINVRFAADGLPAEFLAQEPAPGGKRASSPQF